MKIKFGTDGWSAVIAQDFTYENLAIVVQTHTDPLKIPHAKNHDKTKQQCFSKLYKYKQMKIIFQTGRVRSIGFLMTGVFWLDELFIFCNFIPANISSQRIIDYFNKRLCF